MDRRRRPVDLEDERTGVENVAELGRHEQLHELAQLVDLFRRWVGRSLDQLCDDPAIKAHDPLRDGRRLMDGGDTNQPAVVPKGDAHRVLDAATIGRPAFDPELRQIE